MEPAFAVTSWLLVLFSGFWVIRLAVRYGVDDALRKHREITRRERATESLP